MYQLRRLSGKSPCDDARAEKICQSILESVKEHLQHRQEWAQSQEQWGSASAPRSDPPPAFQTGAMPHINILSQIQQQVPPVAVHKEDSVKRWTLSPSPIQPWRQVNFKKSSPVRDTEVKQFLPSTYGDRQTIEADNSQLLSWAEEPEELGFLPKLNPQVQEFLSGREIPCTGDEEDSDWSAMPKPTLEDSNRWVLWHTQWVQTLAWWPELREVPNQMDLLQFARRLMALFQLPMVRCCMFNMVNDYSAPPVPHCIDRDVYLPLIDMKFGGQDYQLKQPEKTLAYAKTLQHWVEKAQLPMLGEPHQLVECVWELRVWSHWGSLPMLKTLVTFELSNGVRITPARMTEPVEPVKSWEWSHSQTRRGHIQGSFVATLNMERSMPAATTPAKDPLATSSSRAETQLEVTSFRPQMPPPGFMDIARSLWGDISWCATVEIPLELTAPQGLLVGTAMATMISTCLWQDVVTGAPYLDMVTTSMSLVSLGVTPTAVDHPMPTLEGWEDLESG